MGAASFRCEHSECRHHDGGRAEGVRERPVMFRNVWVALYCHCVAARPPVLVAQVSLSPSCRAPMHRPCPLRRRHRPAELSARPAVGGQSAHVDRVVAAVLAAQREQRRAEREARGSGGSSSKEKLKKSKTIDMVIPNASVYYPNHIPVPLESLHDFVSEPAIPQGTNSQVTTGQVSPTSLGAATSMGAMSHELSNTYPGAVAPPPMVPPTPTG